MAYAFTAAPPLCVSPVFLVRGDRIWVHPSPSVPTRPSSPFDSDLLEEDVGDGRACPSGSRMGAASGR